MEETIQVLNETRIRLKKEKCHIAKIETEWLGYNNFRNWRRQEFFMKKLNYTIEISSYVLPWLFCHDLAMILTSVPCIMISLDLDKGMINHHLARLTMILATIACLRSLGNLLLHLYTNINNTSSHGVFSEKLRQFF